ncbi:glycerophosphoryl diester phosphodiesterase, partial [Phenoliferia sp. Uapishka_3]
MPSAAGSGSNPDEAIDLSLLGDVPAWLRSLRLHKYTPNFEHSHWKDMVMLDDAGLEAKGVGALGARRKLLKVFETVRGKMGMPSMPGDGAGSTKDAGSVSMLFATALLAASIAAPVFSSPVPAEKRWAFSQYFDLQAHRGGRGHVVENTLPAFADSLNNGVTSLEMDVGLTKDGHLIVWHDEQIDPLKCQDTIPVATDDPIFPYVGKYLANLTLAQVKTLDCGSVRLDGFPLAVTVPGTKLATLEEMFDFVACATDAPVLFNIESKVDGDFHNLTRSPEDFMEALTAVYKPMGCAMLDRITHQSFDWRMLVLSKIAMPELRTSALCSDANLWKPLGPGRYGNLTTHGSGPSNWLAGIDIDSFPGTVGEKVALAAHSIKADFLSPSATSAASTASDVGMSGYIPFTTKAMVDKAHLLGLQVKPWTTNRLNQIDFLVNEVGVDGLITDFPRDVRLWAIQQGLNVAPLGNENRVKQCLKKHNQLTQ